MKIEKTGKHIVRKAKIIWCFGNAWLIRRGHGRHELIGGTDNDYTAAKEWTSFFAHEITFNRAVPSPSNGECAPAQANPQPKVV
jgi:hypothetical protein